MKTICFFDLPMVEKKDLRRYRIFRKKLIKEGFIMIQFSVYVKSCPNRDAAYAITKAIKKICPPEGNIRILNITEKQYDDIEILVGTKNIKEKIGLSTGLIVI